MGSKNTRTCGSSVKVSIEHIILSLVITFCSYRLNIFGFPNSAALDQQNLGLLDQRLAYVESKDYLPPVAI